MWKDTPLSVIAAVALVASGASLAGQLTLRSSQVGFGTSVAVHGIRTVVGAPSKFGAGSAEVFRLGQRIQTLRSGAANNRGFGRSVAFVGDFDGDTFSEIAVGGLGRVEVFSGRTWKILLIVSGPSDFGYSIAGLPDINGDKVPDLAIGSPTEGSVPAPGGTLHFVSGANGTLIRKFVGRRPNAGLGLAVSSAGDFDKDGFPDVVASCPGVDTVDVYSSKSAKLLFSITDQKIRHLGLSVAANADLNGDGIPEIAAGSPFAQGGSVVSGRVIVYSGKDRKALFQLEPKTSVQGWFGFAVAYADINRDAVLDILVGEPRRSGFTGRLTVFSGKDGSRILEEDGTSGSGLGTAVASAFGGFGYAVGAPTGDRGGVVHLRPGNLPSASSKSFGTSCGSRTPATLQSSAPKFLTDLQIHLRNLKPPMTGVVVIGASKTSWSGAKLPLDLAFLGMTGCRAYTSWDLTVPFSQYYKTTHQIQVPVSWLIPQPIYLQAWVTHFGANPSNIATTNALELRIGL